MASNDFVEQEDGFADDDLISPDDFNALRISQGQPDAGKSYLERDNFENELGSAADDPFAENFGDISKHNVVDVVAEGDFVGRYIREASGADTRYLGQSSLSTRTGYRRTRHSTIRSFSGKLNESKERT